ncbi:YpjP family protein [Oceanobacillus sp. FSL K6-2867]|uniref:YpjP family protein n=1 Tax=Oceanobacillus sp. FSL K6-2867 TaxID=2954748 RepID=UPI0030D82BA3
MKFWMRKLAVVLVTIFTLGMYSPTALLEIDAEENEDAFSSGADINNLSSPVTELREEIDYTITAPIVETNPKEMAVRELTQMAREQAITKFGPKIANQVETEFTDIILPNIEAVLASILDESGTDNYAYFAITENPAEGYGERIFNVYDERRGKDIAKFHVRRDNRPLEGHYFNFHYHVSSDGFKEHHDIGEIYWDKNTPPKWMA